jgi:sulfoxide reductase heme-binding subunit YedZ
VYVVGVLGIIHFVWLVKNVYTEPAFYGTILAILLLTRVKLIKQAVIRWRRNLGRKNRQAVESAPAK